MITCTEAHHPDHVHQHGPNCGHTAIRHDAHVDYLHGGHLHYMHGDHVDEHVIAVNPMHCTPEIRCSGHEHGPSCEHEAVPHGDHIDYLVKGRLHHPHGDHCDDHGPVQLGKPMRYYITACRQNEQVSADSTFATLLLRGLRGEADFFHEGIISADQLGIYLAREVPKHSLRPQTPQFNSIANAQLSEGQFFFLTGPVAPR